MTDIVPCWGDCCFEDACTDQETEAEAESVSEFEPAFLYCGGGPYAEKCVFYVYREAFYDADGNYEYCGELADVDDESVYDFNCVCELLHHIFWPLKRTILCSNIGPFRGRNYCVYVKIIFLNFF